jgi:hypothetical protein
MDGLHGRRNTPCMYYSKPVKKGQHESDHMHRITPASVPGTHLRASTASLAHHRDILNSSEYGCTQASNARSNNGASAVQTNNGSVSCTYCSDKPLSIWWKIVRSVPAPYHVMGKLMRCCWFVSLQVDAVGASCDRVLFAPLHTMRLLSSRTLSHLFSFPSVSLPLMRPYHREALHTKG